MFCYPIGFGFAWRSGGHREGPCSSLIKDFDLGLRFVSIDGSEISHSGDLPSPLE
jgi:hypothetical protein